MKQTLRKVRSAIHAWFGRPRPRGKQVSLSLEALENRWVPAAMTFKVTNALDEVGGDPGLSLREAVQAANLNPGEDTIIFKQSLSGASIQLSLGEIPITDSVIIKGLGKNNLSVLGSDKARIFHITSGAEGGAQIDTTIAGIRLSDGSPSDKGGAILQDSNITGLLTIQSCILSDNTAGGEGGAIAMDAGDLTIQNSSFLRNTSGAEGGAIHFFGNTMEVTSSTFRRNHSDQQGGAVNTNGQVTIQQCTFDSNTAGDEGGAIEFGEEHGGTLTMRNSTVSRNHSDTQCGGLFFYSGEGSISNCTFSSNSCAQEGGGVLMLRGELKLTNCTVTRNTASKGGGLFVEGGSLRLENTIAAGNHLGDGSGNDVDQNDATIDALFCLIQHGKDSVNGIDDHNIFGVSAKLGPLADNGGPTKTHLPQPGSPVINMGSNALANAAGLKTDQRIFMVRIFDGTVDIGSVETGAEFTVGRGWSQTG